MAGRLRNRVQDNSGTVEECSSQSLQNLILSKQSMRSKVHRGANETINLKLAGKSRSSVLLLHDYPSGLPL